MRYLLIASVIFMPTVVCGQQLPAEVVLKVTPDELNIISEGLQTQPFGKVVPLMTKLREQVMQQQPKPVPLPVPAPEPKE